MSLIRIVTIRFVLSRMMSNWFNCAIMNSLASADTMNRRQWLTRSLALGTGLAGASLLPSCAFPPKRHPSVSSPFSATDDAFLLDLQRACVLFFWENADPLTGLIKDRSSADGTDDRPAASIAATGFGLTGLCIADIHGFLPARELQRRVLTTLRYLWSELPNEHGFYYHFIDARTGRRHWNCELSSIDTAILLCGVLSCRQFFRDPEIRRLATRIYERVEWPWMLNDGDTFSHGWKPESGFLPHRWNQYSELMMIYLLALGSPTHPVPASTWEAWERPWFEYQGFRYINPHAPLFIHQYSHAWFDFRNRRDTHADYFENSVLATRAHKVFCLNLRDRFPDYEENLWGITASDTAKGYRAWGGPPEHGDLDGTLVPCAAAGSLPFLPNETLAVLKTMRERFGKTIWKRYGFIDAFNPLTNWFNPDVIGIDVGITLLMTENARSGQVWKTFSSNPEIPAGMRRAGFQPSSSQHLLSPSSNDHMTRFQKAQTSSMNVRC